MQFQSSASHSYGSPTSSMYLPGMNGDGRIHHSILNRSKQHLDLKSADPAKVIVASSPKVVTFQDNGKGLTKGAEDSIVHDADSKYIAYYGNPAGPRMWFKRPKSNRKNNSAATIIQKAARGKCARTNVYIRKLEKQIEQIKNETKSDIDEIEKEKKAKMLKLRRKTTKKEAKTLKQHMVCTETASQGAHLISFLRNENKKLREKNTKIAESIVELKVQNERLEKATATTGDNQSLLTKHYDKIKATNEALKIVVPQYESKLRELEESMETRRQFCLAEHKMKVLYVKVVGTLAELVENRSPNKELVDEVVTMCLEIQSELPVGNAGEDLGSDESIADDSSAGGSDEESDTEGYDSCSDSDSNDYDEYSIAVFEGAE